MIIETNVNEYDISGLAGLCFQRLAANFELLCKALANLDTKVIFLILPLEPRGNTAKIVKIIENFNRKKIKQYHFNCIDMQKYYNEKGINPFFVTTDIFHQLSSLMRIVGEKIIANLHHFKKHPKTHFKMPNFLIKSPQELFDKNLPCKELQNSLLNEKIYKLDEKDVLKFKNSYSGYGILGIYICNFFEVKPYNIASFILKNTKQKIIKGVASHSYHLHTLEQIFTIDEESFLYFNQDNEAISEGSLWIHKNKGCIWLNNAPILNNISHIGLSHFFLVKLDENFCKKDIDLQSLESEENIDIPYDFTHILPPFELYKEIIEEYCQRMDVVKQKALQDKITQLQKAMIRHYLAYKLGSCMIRNSKSLLGCIKMPFLLITLTIAHKERPKFQLPKLVCDEALEEKQSVAYKLGEAFIKASKTWYKGGYFKFCFKDVPRLKKEFKTSHS